MDKIIFDKSKWFIQHLSIKNGLKQQSDPFKVSFGQKKIFIKLQLKTEDNMIKFGIWMSRPIEDYLTKATFLIRSDIEPQIATIDSDGVHTQSEGISFLDLEDVMQFDTLTISVEILSSPVISTLVLPMSHNLFYFQPGLQINVDSSVLNVLIRYNANGSIGEICDLRILIDLLELERKSPNPALKEQIKVNLNNGIGKFPAADLYMIGHNFGIENLKAPAMAYIRSHLMELIGTLPMQIMRDMLVYYDNMFENVNTILPSECEVKPEL